MCVCVCVCERDRHTFSRSGVSCGARNRLVWSCIVDAPLSSSPSRVTVSNSCCCARRPEWARQVVSRRRPGQIKGRKEGKRWKKLTTLLSGDVAEPLFDGGMAVVSASVLCKERAGILRHVLTASSLSWGHEASTSGAQKKKEKKRRRRSQVPA